MKKSKTKKKKKASNPRVLSDLPKLRGDRAAEIFVTVGDREITCGLGKQPTERVFRLDFCHGNVTNAEILSPGQAAELIHQLSWCLAVELDRSADGG